MELEETSLDGVVILTPRAFADDRGVFWESWNARQFKELGLSTNFVQDNQSISALPGTVRGLHYQAPPHAQAKLVRVLAGEIFDVAVDFRKGSPTFGKWTGAVLSAENRCQLLIPAGFLHGFVTRAPDTAVAYKCSDFYARQSEGSVRFDDPELGIDWGIDPQTAVLSEKDAAAPFLRETETPFVWETMA